MSNKMNSCAVQEVLAQGVRVSYFKHTLLWAMGKHSQALRIVLCTVPAYPLSLSLTDHREHP